MCLLQGINRLGAGPRKPGIARPVDPNRFIVQDLVPEGVENDQDYKRMVQDVRALLLNRNLMFFLFCSAWPKACVLCCLLQFCLTGSYVLCHI